MRLERIKLNYTMQLWIDLPKSILHDELTGQWNGHKRVNGTAFNETVNYNETYRNFKSTSYFPKFRFSEFNLVKGTVKNCGADAFKSVLCFVDIDNQAWPLGCYIVYAGVLPTVIIITIIIANALFLRPLPSDRTPQSELNQRVSVPAETD